MARLLERWIADPTTCAYLPEERSRLEYRIMLDVSARDLEYLLERGWRRFGPAYFRPRCAGCSACVPLRVPVATFRPTRSQKRVAAKARRLRLEIATPKIDLDRLALYERWHRQRAEHRGWEHDELDARQYAHQFSFPHPAAREFSYWDVDRLVAIAIVDETPNALSAVYTFYDPDYAKLSPGTASILRQIETAQAAGKRHVYLGYRVLGCRSSEYKGNFGPHELMTAWPRAGEPGTWTPAGIAPLTRATQPYP